MKHRRLLAWLFAALLLAAPLGSACALSVSKSYPATDGELVNPYIGNAVWADDDPEHAQPFTLVYADLTWAEFEPQPGVYDFASFERENRFSLWRTQGKHLILRFVMDVPSSRKHRDIPDWLYEMTDEDGLAYNISYGRGYSPNYENEALMTAHRQAIAALGERYGSDPFVAYIQLGSLGHWGEWHVHEDAGVMPPQAAMAAYVRHYAEAFPDTYLLMRRPFAVGAELGLGLFNDTAGEPRATLRWLTWLQNGGDFETADGTDALVPMPDAWQTAPIGGELSTSMRDSALLGEDLDQTLSLFALSHASWIGPGSFADIRRGGKYQSALDELNRLIGYRLRITRCDAVTDGDGYTHITLWWMNDGVAPFYFDWQPTLRLTDESGTERLLPVDLRLVTLLPGLMKKTDTLLPEDLPGAGAYTLQIGIVDPLTGEAGVALAMEAETDGLWATLAEFPLP